MLKSSKKMVVPALYEQNPNFIQIIEGGDGYLIRRYSCANLQTLLTNYELPYLVQGAVGALDGTMYMLLYHLTSKFHKEGEVMENATRTC